MKDSGKSRADLWAFAALVGLYKGIENNNKACDGKANAAVCGHREAFQDGCEVDFPRIPRFQTGRKDCIGNVQFFKFGSNFGSNLNHFFRYNLLFGSIKTPFWIKSHFCIKSHFWSKSHFWVKSHFCIKSHLWIKSHFWIKIYFWIKS